MFDVTSTLGTSLVVAVPASAAARAEGGAKALRDAVVAEHKATHPEYGDVSATFMYGLRQVPESSASAFGALSQWVAVTDTALRHRTFCWLMVALEPSVVPPGEAEALAAAAGAEAFGSPGSDVSGSRIWADYEEETQVEPQSRRSSRRSSRRRRFLLDVSGIDRHVFRIVALSHWRRHETRDETDKSVRFSAAVGVARSVSRCAMATLNYVPRRCFGALRVLTYHS